MAHGVVVSNGALHVGINAQGLVHDFYYPYIGHENHTPGKELRHRIGVWIDGTISWLDTNSDEWNYSLSYPHEALIGRCVVVNKKLGIQLEFDDAVDATHDAFLRNIHVINTDTKARQVRLFMHQAFIIGDSASHNDTAQYLLSEKAILHYRGDRAFIISARSNDIPFDQHSIGLFGSANHEGTYKDAEDGELSNSAVEQGRVDSTIRLCLDIGAHSSARVEYWIVAATSIPDAVKTHIQVQQKPLIAHLQNTQKSWQKWLKPALKVADRFDEKTRQTFIQSLLLVKSHVDNNGAVIASTDTSSHVDERDTYAYCWPRDAAYTLWPLIRLGYCDEPERFFAFCQKAMHPDGYLMPKYRADGTAGSSWHPYSHDMPPIQEDETALTVFMFAQYYHTHPSSELLGSYYKTMVLPMTSFLARYIDDTTKLPKPSYDIWGEKYLTTTYTTAVVYAALLAAAELADAAEDADSAVAWRSVADDMYIAAHKHLFNKQRKSFYKGFVLKDGNKHYDDTIDSSSFFGAFMYGLFPSRSKQLQESLKTLLATFAITHSSPGVPRYEKDTYQQPQSKVPNPWTLCTLWLAQYYTEHASMNDSEAILSWIHKQISATGMLPEQMIGQETTSVTPLVWSHAEYIATLLDTITETDTA